MIGGKLDQKVVIGIGVVAVAALALAASRSTAKPPAAAPRKDLAVKGFPINLPDFEKLVAARNMPEANAQFLMGYLHAPTIQVALGQVNDVLRQQWKTADEVFRVRRQLLPPDAKGSIDKYSKERYQLPIAQMGDPWPHSLWVDEFGREPSGLPVNFGKLYLQTFQQVAPLIPGVGTAAAAALAFVIAIGEGKSLKDAAISSARAAIPIQYKFAFDLGVGIASGQGVDEAAKQAFFANVPGSQQAYEQGKEVARKAGIKA